MTSREPIVPGDVCLIVGTYQHTYLIGCECRVVGYSQESEDPFGRAIDFVIEVPGHPSPVPSGLWTTPRNHLRKKPPPKREKTTSWAAIEKLTKWNPTKVCA